MKHKIHRIILKRKRFADGLDKRLIHEDYTLGEKCNNSTITKITWTEALSGSAVYMVTYQDSSYAKVYDVIEAQYRPIEKE